MSAPTFNAKSVAADASLMLGRNVRASVIRGLARGESGVRITPTFKRFEDDAYTSHAYSAAERTAILTALASRQARRDPEGKAPKLPAIGAGSKPKPAARTKADAATGARKVRVKPGTGMAATVKPDAAPTA